MDLFYNSLKNADADKLELLSNEIYKINRHNDEYWNFIIQNTKLDDSMIIKNLNNVNLELLISRQSLTDNILKDKMFLDLIKKKNLQNQILQDQKLSMDILFFYVNYFDNVDWNYISKYQNLTLDFMEDNNNKLNWDEISLSQFMTLEFLVKYNEKINWNLIGQNIKLEFLFNDSFIEIFSDKDLSDIIIWSNKISKDYLKKNLSKLNYNKILELLEYKKIDEDLITFILEKFNYDDEIYSIICENQSLSLNFINKNLNKLNINSIIENQIIDINFIKSNVKNINKLSYNEELSEELLLQVYEIKNQFDDELDWNYISQFSKLGKKSLLTIKELKKDLILENIYINIK